MLHGAQVSREREHRAVASFPCVVLTSGPFFKFYTLETSAMGKDTMSYVTEMNLVIRGFSKW